jgi:hypothetical protein
MGQSIYGALGRNIKKKINKHIKHGSARVSQQLSNNPIGV